MTVQTLRRRLLDFGSHDSIRVTFTGLKIGKKHLRILASTPRQTRVRLCIMPFSLNLRKGYGGK